ncbi:CHC2 zinc finger domain-containing protein [Chitinophaga sp. GCM10012297]|uniref:Toprim domain-containing protein n=1 Tax=Chitinophaga chungangae TaxID=2821488 RepID=A0ABS3YJ00_9BACT|nr:CHC2 zinc finger domain-containing protein [Chitinophaga chungangae]MBO9154074.1 toprim domain-containing protein [Chitinophaga chungangae]
MEISEIKQRLGLSQVLQHYGLKPDKSHRLHCPFHDDTTPSLQVYYKTQTCYCFSSNCRTHGKALDVIDFVMYKEGFSKGEAIRRCQELAGGVPAAVPLSAQPRTAILGRMFTYFKNAVHNSKPAQDYIQSRGLDATQLEIGYNSGQFHHGQRKDAALITACEQAGLLAAWGTNTREGGQAYKAFGRNCIVFALRNAQHQVSGLYFRSIINDSDQRHFYLKDRSGLYPCYPAAATQRLILTESVIDAAVLAQHSFVTRQYSVLACYGTNGLTPEHRGAIAALPHLTEIIFAFDGDDAGKAATAKYSTVLGEQLPHVQQSFLPIPEGEDLAGLAAGHEPDVLEHLFTERKPLFTSSEKPVERTSPSPQTSSSTLDSADPYKLRYTTATAIYTVQGGVSKAPDSMKVTLVIEHPCGSKRRNKLDLYEDKQVERLAREVATALGLDEVQVADDLRHLTDALDAYRDSQRQPKPDPATNVYPLTVAERSEAETFLKAPALVQRLGELLGKTGIIGEEQHRIFLLLIAISHKMPQPLHALIQGSSGSGKTRLLRQISDCMPPEKVTRLTRVSDKVLYNYPETYFENRLLCLEDIDGLGEEAEFAFRELQSNGELNSATSIKLEDGRITSGQKTVRGPIASLACTTRGELYEDNMSRVFLVAVDESAEQTQRILTYQNSVAAGIVRKTEEAQSQALIRNLVRTLMPLPVINPYAGRLQLPPAAHKIRRLNDLFLSFVKMVTLLHQYQREKDDEGRLLTTVSDLATAIDILFDSIVLKVDELDGSLRQFFEQLKQYLEKQHGTEHPRHLYFA